MINATLFLPFVYVHLVGLHLIKSMWNLHMLIH